MIVDMTRDDLNRINQLLDEAETADEPADCDSKLRQALLTSERALDRLLSDPSLSETLSYADNMAEEYRGQIRAAVMDVGLFRAFLQAEARLLADFGLDPKLVKRFVDMLWETREDLIEGAVNHREAIDNLVSLQKEVSEAAQQLVAQRSDARRWKELCVRTAFGIGGAFIVATNAVVGTATAPITGGISVAGVALSAVGGSKMIDRATAGWQ